MRTAATASDLYEHRDFCLVEAMGHKQMPHALQSLIPIFKRMRHRCVIKEKALERDNAARKEDACHKHGFKGLAHHIGPRRLDSGIIAHRFTYPKNVAKHESRRCTERKPRCNPPPTIRCACPHRRCMKHA